MTKKSVVVIGMPATGKTTFLAALWHIVTADEIKTRLSFEKLGEGQSAYLKQISNRWRDARTQERTATQGSQHVNMFLKDENQTSIQVTFPDVPGESYRTMWEDRVCDEFLVDIIKDGGVLLFIHSDTIRAPRWITEDTALSNAMGLEPLAEEPVEWTPNLSPTQVQIVDLLQSMRQPPLDAGARRIMIALSAWDKVSSEGLSPEDFIKVKLPLLNQYLSAGADGWEWCAAGISAQGGDYNTDGEAPKASAEDLRKLSNASSRVRYVQGDISSSDLTEAVIWLTR